MKRKEIEILESGPSIQLVSNLANKNMFYGYPHGGAMDKESCKVVNEILLKSPESKMLECSLKGCKLFFRQDINICITGADMNWKIDNIQVKKYVKTPVKAGQILVGGYAKQGLRSYIGFSHDIEKIDKRLIYLSDNNSKKIESKNNEFQFELTNHLNVRRGPEWGLLTQESKEALMIFDAGVTKDLSRMGAYLQSETLHIKGVFPTQSVCTFPGVIQLLPNGQLLVLNKDAQTTGGYPRIAYFDDDNLSKFNQLSIGDKLKWRLLL